MSFGRATQDAEGRSFLDARIVILRFAVQCVYYNIKHYYLSHSSFCNLQLQLLSFYLSCDRFAFDCHWSNIANRHQPTCSKNLQFSRVFSTVQSCNSISQNHQNVTPFSSKITIDFSIIQVAGKLKPNFQVFSKFSKLFLEIFSFQSFFIK